MTACRLLVGMFVGAGFSCALPGTRRPPSRQPESQPAPVVRRLSGNPIVTPQTDPTIGTNINGPSLIRAPKWLPKPLGKYYLYFADHNGKYIRLAYADRLQGPWTVYRPGTLQLSQSFFTDHIASPDVLVDEERRQIRLYYHGLTPGEGTQHTRVAISKDGIDFKAIEEPVGRGSAYWRVFRYSGWWYALAMPGKLYRSRDGLTPFEPGPQLFPSSPTQVHNGALLRGGTLMVFYTRSSTRAREIRPSESCSRRSSWDPIGRIGSRRRLRNAYRRRCNGRALICRKPRGASARRTSPSARSATPRSSRREAGPTSSTPWPANPASRSPNSNRNDLGLTAGPVRSQSCRGEAFARFVLLESEIALPECFTLTFGPAAAGRR